MSEQKTILLKAVIEAAQDRIKDTIARAYFPLFIEGFFRHASLSYLQRRTPEHLAEHATKAWLSFQHRSLIEEALIDRTQTKEGYQLTIIQTEKPFLYDTITLFLETQKITPHLFAHPVWCVVRNSEGILQEIHSQNVHGGQWESLVFIYTESLPNTLSEKTLIANLQHVLTCTHTVVDDYPAMGHVVDSVSEHLLLTLSPEEQVTAAYLQWLGQHHFFFLGYRYFAIETDPHTHAYCITDPKNLLGLFKHESYNQEVSLMPSLARWPELFLKQQLSLLTYAKTNYRSPIHRPSRVNSLVIIDKNSQGDVIGMHQFIGLYTRASFTQSVFAIPLIKEKVQQVFDSFGTLPKSYDGKKLASILQSIPQDEILAANAHDIQKIATKILHLQDEDLLALFLRPDPFDAFVSVLIYMPPERYNILIKDRFAEILQQALGGEMTSCKVLIDDLPFARILFVISHDTPRKISYDLPLLQQELGQVSLSWRDSFLREINAQFGGAAALHCSSTYQNAFATDYQEKFSISDSLADIPYLEKLAPENPIQIRLYHLNTCQKLKIKIYHYETALPLSDMLPILNNLGLQPAAETSFRIQPKDKQDLWIHDFDLKTQLDSPSHATISLIIDAFHRVWQGESENDGLNRLISLAHLEYSQVMILRAYIYYLKQIKFPYSFAYCEETLVTYPHIAKEIINLFWAKFAPSLDLSWEIRQQQQKACEVKIKDLLQNVTNLDHDRILYRLLTMIQATLRTNYFQEDLVKNSIAFKLESAKIIDLPAPHPWVETFIYSPRFQAIHLRGSNVSRGGIRWSDRAEDFRTEILSLMKAQTVKNSIIVPLGAKGGFVLKNPGRFMDRQQLQDEVVACYRLMMQHLLSLCDNRIDDRIVPPAHVIRYDEDDPYLVVAADKGTATFSDIANSIAQDHHFWLDDAFASGGSTGYDHKQMGITAKGAWESIKHHFREMNRDIQNQDFTVVGVGDMSGDVFGNGMLMSPHILLLAAFNHQHIFIDPTPHSLTSFQERQRLFHLPYSTWADYQPHLLSTGGGIFERSQKKIPLSPEIRAAFAITEESLPPEKLIQKLLQAPIDLLWFGGIGTLVKASTEADTAVNDAINDSLRIDAKMLKARVIGEGANLGMTQKARIEYALQGGRLNADFIDNSAGVDCSDHEVNIKILFHRLLREGTVTRPERDTLLKEMTEDVAQLILKDNCWQTQVLSQLECLGVNQWGRWQNLMHFLENTIKLNRSLECLPDDEEIDRRLSHKQGPTRPELAVLLSYSKNALNSLLVQHLLSDSRGYEPYLFAYFPTALQKKFPQAIRQHPLRTEIIATVLANILINRMGPLFILEQAQSQNIEIPAVVDAFFLIDAWLDLDSLWQAIETLDTITVEKQMHAFQTIQNVLGAILTCFIRQNKQDSPLPPIHDLLSQASLWMTDKQRQEYISTATVWQDFPKPVAEKLQQFFLIPDILMIHQLAQTAQQPFDSIAGLYFQTNEAFVLDYLQSVLNQVKRRTQWQDAMLLQLAYEITTIQTQLILSMAALPGTEQLKLWQEKYATLIPHLQSLQPETELAYFSFIINQLKNPLKGLPFSDYL